MKIPVIDFAHYSEEQEQMDNLGKQVGAALSQTGFMSLLNVGISKDLLREVFAASQFFFSLPEEQKMKIAYTSATENFGYQGLGKERLNKDQPMDLKETLTLRNPQKHLDAGWPSDEFRDLMIHFYDQTFAAARRVQRVIAAHLKLPRDYFVERHQGENVSMRLLYYPSVESVLENQPGAGAHTDYGMMTLLFQDSQGGVEVLDRNDGLWSSGVQTQEDQILVNTGDLMEHWTNGHFLSTVHRVPPRINLPDRYSIAVFFDPDSDVLIDSIDTYAEPRAGMTYKQVTAGEYIQNRIAQSHK